MFQIILFFLSVPQINAERGVDDIFADVHAFIDATLASKAAS